MDASQEGKVYVSQGQKKTADMRNSSWVMFPDGRHYLLPKYMNIKYSPLFDENGEITSINFGEVNTAISDYVDTFLLEIKPPVEKDGQTYLSNTTVVLTAMLKMLKHMLEINYTWDLETYKVVLTLRPDQLGQMVKVMLDHIWGNSQ